MAAKKTSAKSARSTSSRRPRRAGGAAARPAPAPERAPLPPESTPPKPSPTGAVAVGVILAAIVGLALWGWCQHRSRAAAAPAPVAAATAPAPSAPVAVVQPIAPSRPAPAARHRRRAAREDRGVLAPAPGKAVSLRCWRAENGQAELDIFNGHNRRVRSIASQTGPQGWLNLSWDGRDDAGKAVPSGAYFARPSQKGDQTIVEVRIKN